MLKELIKGDSVGLFDFKHGNQHLSKLLSKIFLYHRDLLQKRVQVNIEILVIINLIQLLLENYLHNHQPQSKHVSFLEVYFRAFVSLRKRCDQLGRQVDSFKVVFVQNLIVWPVGFFLANDSPPGIVSYSSIPDSDVSSIDGHFRNAFDDGEELIVVLGADVFEESEGGEEDVIGSDEVMERGAMRWYSGVLGFTKTKLHVLETDVLDRAVDGAD